MFNFYNFREGKHLSIECLVKILLWYLKWIPREAPIKADLRTQLQFVWFTISSLGSLSLKAVLFNFEYLKLGLLNIKICMYMLETMHIPSCNYSHKTLLNSKFNKLILIQMQCDWIISINLISQNHIKL